MRRIARALRTFFLVLGGIIALALAALVTFFPRAREPAAVAAPASPEAVARGAYLVRHVTACGYCHSDVDDHAWGRPTKPGRELAGGQAHTSANLFPGVLPIPNLTPHPTGLAGWADGEIARAIREGVGRDGGSLMPVMPYPDYRALGDDDAGAIVAFLKTLPPVDNPRPPKEMPLPMRLGVRLAPEPLDGRVVAPDPSWEPLRYGAYLTTIAGCASCHTPIDGRRRPMRERAFAGGKRFPGPWGTVYSANITPDPDTFVGHATRDEFIDRFKAIEKLGPGEGGGRNTIMPWRSFAGMTRDDLGLIYDYLRTQRPVKGRVDPYQAPEASASN